MTLKIFMIAVGILSISALIASIVSLITLFIKSRINKMLEGGFRGNDVQEKEM